METFKAAHGRILADLKALGWTTSSPYLKVQHATSPNGQVRLWFKAQAVYFSTGTKHTLGDARSLHVEVRGMPTSEVVKAVGGSATGTMVYAGA